MKPCILLFFMLLVLPAPGGAQVSFVSDDYFPAEKEFSELLAVASDSTFDDPDRLAGIDGGRLIREVGFISYSRRSYATGGTSTLSIEVITLLDSRAAYSLLTLLRDAELQPGPPGSGFIETSNAVRFAQGRRWVRITGDGIPGELLRTIARSVSNRIGSTQDITPSIVHRLPTHGHDTVALRYFPDKATYETYAGASAKPYLTVAADAEIVQGRYSHENAAGSLFLLNFPTPQLAEDFYDGIFFTADNMTTLYMKRAGTLVACLDGTFDPASADGLLRSTDFGYAVRWLQDDDAEESILWGVPGIILVTVVNSIFFVSLLCLLSIVVGAALGVGKFILDDKILKKSDEESSHFIRLRLR